MDKAIWEADLDYLFKLFDAVMFAFDSTCQGSLVFQRFGLNQGDIHMKPQGI